MTRLQATNFRWRLFDVRPLGPWRSGNGLACAVWLLEQRSTARVNVEWRSPFERVSIIRQARAAVREVCKAAGISYPASCSWPLLPSVGA